MKKPYESIIYVNHRGHDRGKKTPERESDGGGGGWGDHSLSLSLSPVFFLPLSWPLWFTYMIDSYSVSIYLRFRETKNTMCCVGKPDEFERFLPWKNDLYLYKIYIFVI